MKRFKIKSKLSFIVTSIMIFQSSFTITSYAGENCSDLRVEDSNYSSQFIKYCNDLRDGDTKKYNGLIPNVYDVKLTQSGALETFASKYDPRELDLMTPVKNQGINEVCWAFAGMGALESYLKLKGIGEYDLSEEHARWYSILNEKGYGWNRTASEGGPTQIVPGYFTSGAGAKLEKDIPYSYSSTVKPNNMDNAKTVIDVTDIEYIANDIKSVKRAIKENGAVESCYYDNSYYYNGVSYYYNGSSDTTVNHAITIVGWDDDYPKENFKASIMPENNGAWLIKNSWGKNKYDGGYMWISYEDKILLNGKNGNLNYSIKNAKLVNDEDRKKYQLDDYGSITKCGFTLGNEKVKEAYYMNVFDFTSDYNLLDSVMFMSESIGATYSIYYNSLESNGVPNTDVSKMQLLASGTIDYSGYRTVKVDKYPLKEKKGAIVVKISDPTNNEGISIGCESKVTYVNNNKVAYIPEAYEGESFVMVADVSNNKFIIEDMNGEDMKKASNYTPKNFSIKAITVKGNYDYSNLQFPCDYDNYISYLEDLKNTNNKEYTDKLAVLLNKYDNLHEEMKDQISEDTKSEIQTLREELAQNNHKSGDVLIYNVPWNIKVEAKSIDNNSDIWTTFQENKKDKRLLKVYKINAYDILTNKAYCAKLHVGICNNEYDDDTYIYLLNGDNISQLEFYIADSSINLNINNESYIAIAKNSQGQISPDENPDGDSTIKDNDKPQTSDKKQVISTLVFFALSIFTIYSLTKNKKVI